MNGDYGNWLNYIVPVEDPTLSRTSTPNYETPWWVDTINRGIERASQVATVAEAGYPPYPSYPSPSPQRAPYPMPGYGAPQSSGGIQLSTNTLMILGLIGFAFIFGSRKR